MREREREIERERDEDRHTDTQTHRHRQAGFWKLNLKPYNGGRTEKQKAGQVSGVTDGDNTKTPCARDRGGVQRGGGGRKR